MVASRPVGELVALICRDFGLDPNWDALAEEAWAQAEMDGGAEGSPFAPTDAPPPALAAEEARSAGGSAPPPCALEMAAFNGHGESSCAPRTSPSSAPDG